MFHSPIHSLFKTLLYRICFCHTASHRIKKKMIKLVKLHKLSFFFSFETLLEQEDILMSHQFFNGVSKSIKHKVQTFISSNVELLARLHPYFVLNLELVHDTEGARPFHPIHFVPHLNRCLGFGLEGRESLVGLWQLIQCLCAAFFKNKSKPFIQISFPLLDFRQWIVQGIHCLNYSLLVNLGISSCLGKPQEFLGGLLV